MSTTYLIGDTIRLKATIKNYLDDYPYKKKDKSGED